MLRAGRGRCAQPEADPPGGVVWVGGTGGRSVPSWPSLLVPVISNSALARRVEADVGLQALVLRRSRPEPLSPGQACERDRDGDGEGESARHEERPGRLSPPGAAGSVVAAVTGVITVATVRSRRQMPVAVRVREERRVAGAAAEVERPTFVLFGGERLVGTDLHAANGVPRIVDHRGVLPGPLNAKRRPESRPGRRFEGLA